MWALTKHAGPSDGHAGRSGTRGTSPAARMDDRGRKTSAAPGAAGLRAWRSRRTEWELRVPTAIHGVQSHRPPHAANGVLADTVPCPDPPPSWRAAAAMR